MDRNAFVRGILDDDSPKAASEEQAFLSPRQRDMSMRPVEGGSSDPKFSPPSYDSVEKRKNELFAAKVKEHQTLGLAPASTPTNAGSKLTVTATEDADPNRSLHDAQSMFRYALIFINFTFVVASMLMMMAGIVARENSAVKLCTHCGDITMVSIVFGVVLWLCAMFGFNWIRQRNILFLLVYVAFLVVLSLVLLGIIITGIVFDRDAKEGAENDDFQTKTLEQWKEKVVNTSTQESSLCALQRKFNCSGFQFGCCANSTMCYNASAGPWPPPWFHEVCPVCANQTASTHICTSIVYDTLRKNLGGFLVITSFSMMLVTTGILLAFISRRINQSMD